MNILDIIIGVILLIAFYSGFKKGLFVALASLVGLIAGVIGAVYFSDFAGGYISKWFNWSDGTTRLAAFAVTFLGIVFLVSTAGKFLTKIADFAMLGIVNKLLGGVFALLQYAFILSVLFMFLNNSGFSHLLINDENKIESKLYTPVAYLAPLVIPKILEEWDKHRITDEEIEEATSN